MQSNINNNNTNNKVDFIFFSNKTPNSFKIQIMLLELQATHSITFEDRNVDITKKENYSDEFVKINPNKKVPAIVDNNVLDINGKPLIVFESVSILIYLSQKYSTLIPDVKIDPIGHTNVITWSVWQAANLGPIAGNQTHFFKYSPKVEEYALHRFSNEMQRLLRLLDDRLSIVPYIGGNEFTIADIASAGWLLYLNHAFLYGATSQRFPNIFKWLSLINQRDSIKIVNDDVKESIRVFDISKIRALFTDDINLINQPAPLGIEKVVLKFDQ